MAHRGNTVLGLIALHESEDLFGSVSVSLANQAAGNSTGQRNTSFSLLAGVLYCKVLRGRWFSLSAMRLRSA